ncbi:hypothetical protein Xedl_02508 [Xenorhabdus eapokensis]|uniref:Uncharacterized protein n=1 Tax=Xenorhabdus eapokensis TaxID=1873482 RepID=A0A1Q5TPI8_9GAMM|nr:hypothetical protein Xedl_02508 [Xenorhabdus eapokensis]
MRIVYAKYSGLVLVMQCQIVPNSMRYHLGFTDRPCPYFPPVTVISINSLAMKVQ